MLVDLNMLNVDKRHLGEDMITFNRYCRAVILSPSLAFTSLSEITKTKGI